MGRKGPRGRVTPPDEAVRAVRARRTVIGPFTVRQIGLINAIFRTRRTCHVRNHQAARRGSRRTLRACGELRPDFRGDPGAAACQRAPDSAGTNLDQDVRLTDLDGREIRLAAFAGKPVWVVFWTTWCPPCQQDTPDIGAVFDANRDIGLVAVDVQEPAHTAWGRAERYGLTYTSGSTPAPRS